MDRQLGEIAEPAASRSRPLGERTTIYPVSGTDGRPGARRDIMTGSDAAAHGGVRGQAAPCQPGQAYDQMAKSTTGYAGAAGSSSRDDGRGIPDVRPESSATARRTLRCGARHSGRSDGYALWRVSRAGTTTGQRHHQDQGSGGRDLPAYQALWRFLLTSTDRRAQCESLALDEPLQHLVDEPARLGLRLVDGPGSG